MPVVKTKIKTKGNFSSKKYFSKARKTTINEDQLEKASEDCLQYFIDSSPNEDVAKNWSYELDTESGNVSLTINNSFIQNGQNIAIIIDSGHVSTNGTWVSGQHYLREPIEKALKRLSQLK